MSFCVSRMHSASREIGTQTSVAHMPQPGLAALAAQAASWRACHILRALLGLAGPGEVAAAMLGGDRLHHLGLLLGAGLGAVELQQQQCSSAAG